MSFDGPLEDRIAIRERIESYGDAVFRRDETAWAACWAEDSAWDLMGTRVSGKANIVATWRGAMAGFSSVAFFSTPGAVNVEGDCAEARTYTLEFLVETGGKARRVIGQYDDRLVKQGGRWLFAERSYRILTDN